MSEELLSRAGSGDEQAFRELTDPLRRELHLHCYRMLGSMQDAEDMVQETMLGCLARARELRAARVGALLAVPDRDQPLPERAARRRPPPAARERGPGATFLPRPAWPSRPGSSPTRTCCWRGSPTRLPGPDARYESRETVELAFIAALQALPPRQRAALVLRDVLGYRAAEVAELLDSSEDSVKSALKRARASMEERLPSGRERGSAPGVARRSASWWRPSPTPGRPATSGGSCPC